MNIRRTLCSVALVALAAAPAMANHPWGSYHWNKPGSTVTIPVYDHVTSAWDGYLDQAIVDWDASAVLVLTDVAGQATDTTTRSSCSNVSGRIKVCNYTYGSNGWLGLASINISGSHITGCTAKLNDTYYALAQYNTAGYRDLVMCQEVGHCFGIGHQDENQTNTNLGTCMDYTSNPDGPPANRQPNSHDFSQIATQHNHSGADAPVTGEAPPAMFLIQQDGPGQWGELTYRSKDGHQDRYVLDFGNGYKIVTHVLWAEAQGGGDFDVE